MNEREKALHRYAGRRNSLGILAGFTIVFFLLGLWGIFILQVRSAYFFLLVGCIFPASQLLHSRQVPNFILQARKDGTIDQILTDFEQAESVAGDRVRIGRYYAFGAGVDHAFDLRYYNTLREEPGSKRLIAFYAPSGSPLHCFGYGLLHIPRGQKGDQILSEVARALRSRVPHLRIISKGGKYV